MNTEKAKQRLAYIDFMRGLACILMFQTHAYDAWLSPLARSRRFFQWSQLASTLAACSFLFLAGVSLALAIDGMACRGALRGAIAQTTVRRGLKILVLALLFRVQEFLLGFASAPWTDLLRVDILNVIGVSIALIGITCWVAADRSARGFVAAAVALGIAMITPLIWTDWRPRGLPWVLESYLNGVHIYAKPQPWLFPIFPWTAFCFAGLAAGSLLRGEWARQRERLTMALVAAAGIALVGLAWFLDALPVQIYKVYDYWHTSPNFFLIRMGFLLLILSACYWLSGFARNQWGFAKLIQLGQSSLVVYWVHIEFVYGGFSILPKRASSIPMASAGLLVIIAAMVMLSASQVWLLEQGKGLLNRLRQQAWPARQL